MLPHLIFINILCRDFLVIQPDLPAVGFSQQIQATQESAFPRATGPNNHDGIAFIDREVDVLENGVLPIALGEVFYGENGFSHAVWLQRLRDCWE